MFRPKTVDPYEPKDTRLDEETSTLGTQYVPRLGELNLVGKCLKARVR
jgi:hypothetical protein